MSPFGLFLIASGFLIGRAAIRAAPARKLCEEGREDRPNGDCFPAPLIRTPFHESEYRIGGR